MKLVDIALPKKSSKTLLLKLILIVELEKFEQHYVLPLFSICFRADFSSIFRPVFKWFFPPFWDLKNGFFYPPRPSFWDMFWGFFQWKTKNSPQFRIFYFSKQKSNFEIVNFENQPQNSKKCPIFSQKFKLFSKNLKNFSRIQILKQFSAIFSNFFP